MATKIAPSSRDWPHCGGPSEGPIDRLSWQAGSCRMLSAKPVVPLPKPVVSDSDADARVCGSCHRCALKSPDPLVSQTRSGRRGWL